MTNLSSINFSARVTASGSVTATTITGGLTSTVYTVPANTFVWVTISAGCSGNDTNSSAVVTVGAVTLAASSGNASSSAREIFYLGPGAAVVVSASSPSAGSATASAGLEGLSVINT